MNDPKPYNEELEDVRQCGVRGPTSEVVGISLKLTQVTKRVIDGRHQRSVRQPEFIDLHTYQIRRQSWLSKHGGMERVRGDGLNRLEK